MRCGTQAILGWLSNCPRRTVALIIFKDQYEAWSHFPVNMSVCLLLTYCASLGLSSCSPYVSSGFPVQIGG